MAAILHSDISNNSDMKYSITICMTMFYLFWPEKSTLMVIGGHYMELTDFHRVKYMFWDYICVYNVVTNNSNMSLYDVPIDI